MSIAQRGPIAVLAFGLVAFGCQNPVVVDMPEGETVVVGMRPQVAITLVGLGLTLTGIQTALDVDRGLTLINRRIDAEGEDGAGGAH